MLRASFVIGTAALRYDEWSRARDLSDPVPRLQDVAWRACCRRFLAAGDDERASIRAALSRDAFWSMRIFAGRSAVFALRERSPDHVVDGLTAIAMLDPQPEDPRDRDPPELAVLDYAARVLHADADGMLLDAARIATNEVARDIERRVRSPHRGLDGSLYARIDVAAGPGFIRREASPYHPVRPLDRIIVEVGTLLARDRYGDVSVSIATDMPAIWVDDVDCAALRSVRAVASAHAVMRPEGAEPWPPPVRVAWMITAFVAELRDERAARSFTTIAGERRREPPAALLGVQDGTVFCLLVARSAFAGVDAVETRESLERFRAPIERVLRAHPNG